MVGVGSMAAPAGDDAQAALADQVEQFPPPPSFYKLYATTTAAPPPPPSTTTSSAAAAAAAAPDAPLPPPPPTPPVGEYEQYGELHTTEDGVAGLPPHIKKLYNEGADGSIDFRAELSRLNKEVLFTFAELLHTVTESPGLTPASRMQYDTHMMSLGLLFWNMHHLLNHLRPHQARAALQYRLEQQLEERRAAVQALRQQSARIEGFIAQAAGAMVQGNGDPLPLPPLPPAP